MRFPNSLGLDNQFLDAMQRLGLGDIFTFGSDTFSSIFSGNGILLPENVGSPPEFSKNNIDNIIGLPPSVYHTNEPDVVANQVLRSTPVLRLTPGWPEYKGVQGDSGLNLFKFDSAKGKTKYRQILGSAGFNNIKDGYLYVAFENNASVSVSLQNEYSESSFEDMANFASSRIAELRYITGADDLAGVASTIGKGAAGVVNSSSLGGALGGKVGAGADWLADTLTDVTKSAQDVITKVGGSGATKLLSGSKVDFPMIWRGSGYSPSYSITVKLYNPNPADDRSYIEKLIEPLARLVAYMTPLSDSDYTYAFPLLCRVECPGLFSIKAGYISSMDIVLGGDNNDIGFNQRPNQIELRITFGDLYSTMIAKGEGKIQEDRPTISSFINNLKGKVGFPDIERPSTGAFQSNNSFNQLGVNFTNSLPIRARDALASEGILPRVPISKQEAYTDPRINGLLAKGFTSQSAINKTSPSLSEQIRRENKFVLDLDLLTTEYEEEGKEIQLKHRVALAVKNNLELTTTLERWFYDNFEVLNSDNELTNILSPTSSGLSGTINETTIDDIFLEEEY